MKTTRGRILAKTRCSDRHVSAVKQPRIEPETPLTALKRLNQASARLWQTQDLQQGLQKILAATIQLLGADFGNIQIFDPADRVLRIAVHQGFKPGFLNHFREVSTGGRAACGRALRSGRRVIVEDVEKDAAYAPHRSIARAAGYRAELSTPLIARDGRPLGMVSTHFRLPHRPGELALQSLDLYARQAADFIERCGIEQVLRDREEKLQLALDAAAAGTWTWNAKTGEASWDNNFHALHGLTRKHPRSFETWVSRLHKEDKARVLAEIERLRCEPADDIWNVEFRAVRPDGAVIWLHGLGHAGRDKKGKLARLDGIVMDITVRRQTEAALREQEERFRALVRASSCAVYHMNADWTEMQQLVGRDFIADTESPTRDWLRKYICPEDQGRIMAVIKKAIRTKGIFELEHRIIRPDGAIGWTFSRAIPILDAKGIISEWFGMASDVTARKQAEAAVREQRDTAQRYLDVAGVILVALDASGKVTLINRKGCDLLGYREQEIIGRSWFDRILPARQRAGTRKVFEQILSGKLQEVEYHENTILTREGCERLVAWQNRALTDENGRIIGTLSSGEDITARKQAEMALQESETRYRQLIHLLPVAVSTCDKAGRITLHNAAAVTLWGRKPDNRSRWDASHRTFNIAGKPLARSQTCLARATLEGEPIRGVERIIERPDGTRSHVLAFADPLYDGTDQVTGGVNVLVDITERRRALQELRESEERLRAILNTVVDAVITIDKRGIIINVNPATERMFGYTVTEMIGQNVKMLMPSPYREEHDGYIRNYHSTGQAKIIGIGREVKGQRKNGAIFPIELAVSEVAHLQLFTGVIRDLSERRMLEKEILNVSEKERAAIGQDLHDDLGQQLAGLWLLGDALRSNLAAQGSPEVAHADEIIHFVKEALAMTRSLARGLHPVAVLAGGLVSALNELAARTRDMFRIDCRFNCPQAIDIDNHTATHLYRITQEAVTNAVKHTDTKEIDIEISINRNQLVLSVKDQGKGKGNAETMPERHGLGLRIMRYRADLIGGLLDIQHHPSGIGTTVLCSVPIPHPADLDDHPPFSNRH